MLSLNIIGSQKYLSKSKIQNILKTIQITLGLKEKSLINVIFTDTKTIQKLNFEYRKINKPTDVLTFVYNDEYKGEILLNVDIIEKKAQEEDIDNKTQLIKTLIHGFLHLFGYDHTSDDEERKMLKKEREILRTIKL